MNTTEAYLEEYDNEVGNRKMYKKESHPRISLIHQTLPDRGIFPREHRDIET